MPRTHTGRYRYAQHLAQDFLSVLVSIVVAYVLYKTGVITKFLDLTNFFVPLSAFIAGVFFTFVFTVVPAGVAFANIGQSEPVVLIAFFGALGAMLMDLALLRFVKSGLAVDVSGLARTTFHHHLLKLSHFAFLKWFAFISAMFMLATPLPDEPGLFLLGISKIKSKFLPLIFFAVHFTSIYILVSLVSSI